MKSGGLNLEYWVESIWNIRCGDDFVLAEGVVTRARMRAPIQEFCFLLSQVSQWMELKNYFTPKMSGRFVESDGLFYEK